MAESPDLSLKNESIRIENSLENHKLKIIFDSTQVEVEIEFAENGMLPEMCDHEGPFGNCECIRWIESEQITYYFIIYPDVPFVCVQNEVSNPSDQESLIKVIDSIPFHVHFSNNLTELRSLGCDGLTPATAARASYTFLAVAHPTTQIGIVTGWLNQELGSGSIFSQITADSQALDIRYKSEFGKFLLKSAETRTGDTFLIGSFENTLNGLELYASAIQRYFHIELPPFRGGYCTWYSTLIYGASDEKKTKKLADFCQRELVPFGFETIQIDDHWQAGSPRPKINGGPLGDFTTHNPKGPYPHGMKVITDYLEQRDIKAGIWLMPFAWDPKCDSLKNHPDWFTKRTDGSIYEVSWAGWCLDMTNPEARSFLASAISRITKDWGYRYIKCDALWTGMAVKLMYTPEATYEQDNFGDAVFFDPYKTNVEAIRLGLRTIQENMAPGTFFLTCTIAQNMRSMGASMGLCDAIRIGRDIAAKWSRIIPDARVGGRFFFLNNRVWYNDPDCLMLRKPLTLDQGRAWASFIVVSGALNIVSEWLPKLPKDRLDIFKRSLPMIGLTGRPLDLFQEQIARVWHLADTRGGVHNRRDLLVLFNWMQKSDLTLTVKLTDLNLPKMSEGVFGFEFWSNQFLGMFSDELKVQIPYGACKVIALRAITDHPQVISSSRHITQGIMDITEEEWNNNELHGKSLVVAEDAYELRITNPTSLKLRSTEIKYDQKDQQIISSNKAEGDSLRINFIPTNTGTVEWKIQFD